MFDKMTDDQTIWEKQETDFTKPLRQTGAPNLPRIRLICVFLVLACMGVLVFVSLSGMIEHLDADSYMICQSVTGQIKIIDKPGYHMVYFAKTWKYPKFKHWKKEDVKIYFNDAVMVPFDVGVRIALPQTFDERIKFHIKLGGNLKILDDVLHSIVRNAVAYTADTMSSREAKTNRMQFATLVSNQLKNGLFLREKSNRVVNGFQLKVFVKDDKGEFVTIDEDSMLSRMGLILVNTDIAF